MHPDALGGSDLERYDRTCDGIVEREVDSLRWRRTVKCFRWITRAVRRIPKVRGLWYRMAIKNLYSLPAPDWPPVIENRDGRGASGDNGRRRFLLGKNARR